MCQWNLKMFFNWGHFFTIQRIFLSWGQKIILGSRKSAILGIIWTPDPLLFNCYVYFSLRPVLANFSLFTPSSGCLGSLFVLFNHFSFCSGLILVLFTPSQLCSGSFPPCLVRLFCSDSQFILCTQLFVLFTLSLFCSGSGFNIYSRKKIFSVLVLFELFFLFYPQTLECLPPLSLF